MADKVKGVYTNFENPVENRMAWITTIDKVEGRLKGSNPEAVNKLKVLLQTVNLLDRKSVVNVIGGSVTLNHEMYVKGRLSEMLSPNGLCFKWADMFKDPKEIYPFLDRTSTDKTAPVVDCEGRFDISNCIIRNAKINKVEYNCPVDFTIGSTMLAEATRKARKSNYVNDDALRQLAMEQAPGCPGETLSSFAQFNATPVGAQGKCVVDDKLWDIWTSTPYESDAFIYLFANQDHEQIPIVMNGGMVAEFTNTNLGTAVYLPLSHPLARIIMDQYKAVGCLLYLDVDSNEMKKTEKLVLRVTQEALAAAMVIYNFFKEEGVDTYDVRRSRFYMLPTERGMLMAQQLSAKGLDPEVFINLHVSMSYFVPTKTPRTGLLSLGPVSNPFADKDGLFHYDQAKQIPWFTYGRHDKYGKFTEIPIFTKAPSN